MLRRSGGAAKPADSAEPAAKPRAPLRAVALGQTWLPFAALP